MGHRSRRVTAAGEVLDPTGIPISVAPNAQQYSAVTWNGQSFVAVWADDRAGPNQNSIFAARIDGDGIVLDPEGISLAIAGQNQWQPDVVSDGDTSFVAWTSYDTTRAAGVSSARIARDGTVLDPFRHPGLRGRLRPGRRGHCLERNRVLRRLGGLARLGGLRRHSRQPLSTSDGTVLDDGITVSLAANEQVNSSIAFDGANYLLVWEDYRRGS